MSAAMLVAASCNSEHPARQIANRAASDARVFRKHGFRGDIAKEESGRNLRCRMENAVFPRLVEREWSFGEFMPNAISQEVVAGSAGASDISGSLCMVFKATIFDWRRVILGSKLYLSSGRFSGDAGDECEHEVCAGGDTSRRPYVAVLNITLLDDRDVTERSQALQRAPVGGGLPTR